MNAREIRDLDPVETAEWQEALQAVKQHRGVERANQLLNLVIDQARRDGVFVPRTLTTAYKNTIPPEAEEKSPGDRAIEHRLRSIIRWNALAIILRANKESSELGGHIASFQSAATLYDIGFGHFWHAPSEEHGGDLIYIQGHCSPGIGRAWPGSSRPPARDSRSSSKCASRVWWGSRQRCSSRPVRKCARVQGVR